MSINTDQGVLKISESLEHLIKKYKLSEIELARRVNIPRATINRLVSGRTPDPRISTLNAIAEYFSITVDDLLTQDFMRSKPQQGMPILDWNEAVEWQQYLHLEKTQIKRNYIEAPDFSTQESKFSLKVIGDAMTPQFPENTLLIIDPHKEIQNRDFVIVRLDHIDQVVFRQLWIDGQYKCLRANNNLFPNLVLQDKDKIIGVVVEGRSTF